HRGIVEAVSQCRNEDAYPGDAADVDDPSTAVAWKMRETGLNGAQHPHHFSVDVVHPLRVGPRDLTIRSPNRASGIVYEDVDLPELRSSRVNGGFHRADALHICANCED